MFFCKNETDDERYKFEAFSTIFFLNMLPKDIARYSAEPPMQKRI